MTPWFPSATPVLTTMGHRKTVSANKSERCQYDSCHAGGPGPEIVLPPTSRFPPGAQVTVRVTASTDGGQTDDSSVTYEVSGKTPLLTL